MCACSMPSAQIPFHSFRYQPRTRNNLESTTHRLTDRVGFHRYHRTGKATLRVLYPDCLPLLARPDVVIRWSYYVYNPNDCRDRDSCRDPTAVKKRPTLFDQCQVLLTVPIHSVKISTV